MKVVAEVRDRPAAIGCRTSALLRPMGVMALIAILAGTAVLADDAVHDSAAASSTRILAMFPTATAIGDIVPTSVVAAFNGTVRAAILGGRFRIVRVPEGDMSFEARVRSFYDEVDRRKAAIAESETAIDERFNVVAVDAGQLSDIMNSSYFVRPVLTGYRLPLEDRSVRVKDRQYTIKVARALFDADVEVYQLDSVSRRAFKIDTIKFSAAGIYCRQQIVDGTPTPSISSIQVCAVRELAQHIRGRDSGLRVDLAKVPGFAEVSVGSGGGRFNLTADIAPSVPIGTWFSIVEYQAGVDGAAAERVGWAMLVDRPEYGGPDRDSTLRVISAPLGGVPGGLQYQEYQTRGPQFRLAYTARQASFGGGLVSSARATDTAMLPFAVGAVSRLDGVELGLDVDLGRALSEDINQFFLSIDVGYGGIGSDFGAIDTGLGLMKKIWIRRYGLNPYARGGLAVLRASCGDPDCAYSNFGYFVEAGIGHEWFVVPAFSLALRTGYRYAPPVEKLSDADDREALLSQPFQRAGVSIDAGLLYKF